MKFAKQYGDIIQWNQSQKMELAQVNEALLKVLCHNTSVVIQKMFELGIEPEFSSA